MTNATQSMSAAADFRSATFLRHHIQTILDFYYPRCLNTEDGGYYNSFRDDGSIADPATQHLVSLTRLIVNFCAAVMLTGRAEYRAAAEHGLAKLRDDFRDPVHGGYFWILDRRHPRDDGKQCYGHAFALLAHAMAAQAGVAGARSALSETFALLEARFWSSADRLYADEFRRDWSPLSSYRGQNCNMHMTEALLAAFEATGDRTFLDRAGLIARRICMDLASRSDNLIWEHYGCDWSHDWDYNRASPRDLFRPYGFLPGHFVEWAKLLLVLERHDPQAWMLPRAIALFDAALTWGADLAHGGLHYAFAPGGERLDLDKYHWVHCEAIAAAGLLAHRTGEARWSQIYDHLWNFSWRYLIDHRYGAWFRVTTADGRRYDDFKSPPGKVDYHGLMAAYDVLKATETR